MKIAGVICEYNPFHNGHKYQLDMIKKSHDAVICVMSGSFVQRGGLAVFDKWTRARAAILGGADLVLELPVRYCLSSAQGFARGAVETLDKTGVCNSLCFGSECADIALLKQSSDIILNEPRSVSENIRRLIKTGMSFPAARQAAYEGIVDSRVLTAPNDILALEYIQALKRIDSPIEPIALPRIAVGHNDTASSGKYASATAIRELLERGADISPYVPFDYSDHARFDINKLTSIFKYKLLTSGSSVFDGIRDAEPGLANRFLKASEYGSFTEMIDFVKTKRCTRTRLQRVALSAILGLTGDYRSPEYIRILGMNDTGRNILAQMRDTAKLPIVNKTADFSDLPLIAEDIRATNLCSLCADRKVPQNRDFTTSPVYIKS